MNFHESWIRFLDFQRTQSAGGQDRLKYHKSQGHWAPRVETNLLTMPGTTSCVGQVRILDLLPLRPVVREFPSLFHILFFSFLHWNQDERPWRYRRFPRSGFSPSKGALLQEGNQIRIRYVARAKFSKWRVRHESFEMAIVARENYTIISTRQSSASPTEKPTGKCVDPSMKSSAKASPNLVLTALAQLAAMRLGVQRAIIRYRYHLWTHYSNIQRNLWSFCCLHSREWSGPRGPEIDA
jgi:hypothetical protein